MWLVSPISTGVGRIGDVDDLEAAARGAPARPQRRPGRGSGPRRRWRRRAAARRPARRAGLNGVEDRAALRRGLDVVLEAERRARVADAGRRGVARRRSCGSTSPLVGQLDDRLAAAVGPDAERADRGVGLAAAGEEVQVGVRVAGRDGVEQLPVGVLAAGDERRRRAGRPASGTRAARGRAGAPPRSSGSASSAIIAISSPTRRLIQPALPRAASFAGPRRSRSRCVAGSNARLLDTGVVRREAERLRSRRERQQPRAPAGGGDPVTRRA